MLLGNLQSWRIARDDKSTHQNMCDPASEDSSGSSAEPERLSTQGWGHPDEKVLTGIQPLS